ncbi:branched-chain amino acid transport system permease protein [Rhodoligotrophos appendicifer]|uniref:branched-chain amino acid ABC transporter permease n=1 Tax=Rhodoligotrophos appendicifer TaxID=987056 RepID=UPI00118525FB|nr:branched-chain amino acid ABC transporter permease [Rhodoligotrophos appendicifer]
MRDPTFAGRVWRLLRHPAIILTIAVAAACVLIGGNLVWLNVSTLMAVFSLIALSVGVTYGQAGILSVAQGTFAALGAYATAILTFHYGWSPFAALPVAILFPALCAYSVAYQVVRLSPLALAIATLLFGKIVDVALRAGGDFTGGYIGMSGIPPLDWFEAPEAFNIVAWLCVIIVVVLYSNAISGAFGRAVQTIRHDTLRASADGINIRRIQTQMFSLGAAIAGLAGWLYAHYTSFISPDSLGLHVSISALLMAVVGGCRYVLGPIVGAVLLTLIVKYVPGQEVQGMFYGGALTLVLLIAPAGIVGALVSLSKLRVAPMSRMQKIRDVRDLAR